MGTGLHVDGVAKQYPWLEAQLQATLNVIPAYTWYALPSGALTLLGERTNCEIPGGWFGFFERAWAAHAVPGWYAAGSLEAEFAEEDR
jgi:hypothetical protein